jgi:hypothetical protein
MRHSIGDFAKITAKAIIKGGATSALFSAGFSYLFDGKRGAEVGRDAVAGLVTGAISSAITVGVIGVAITVGILVAATPAVVAMTSIAVGIGVDYFAGNSIKNALAPAFGLEQNIYQ